jgi:hypothetical protein
LGKARFTIELWPLAKAELDALRVFDRKRARDAIDTQLPTDPLAVTRKKKPLWGVVAGFEFSPPLRELKVGEYRVLFDVDEVAQVVNVRPVRRKPPGKSTEEILL